MNEEYDYMEGFEDLVYTLPTTPSGYAFFSLPFNKLSVEQLEFLKIKLLFSNYRWDVDFENDTHLALPIDNPVKWFTTSRIIKYDKEISFNDIFKYKEQ